MKKMKLASLAVVASLVASPLAAAVKAKRFADPLITPEMLPGEDGANINGPSLVRLPGWVKNPLARYYL